MHLTPAALTIRRSFGNKDIKQNINIYTRPSAVPYIRQNHGAVWLYHLAVAIRETLSKVLLVFQIKSKLIQHVFKFIDRIHSSGACKYNQAYPILLFSAIRVNALNT